MLGARWQTKPPIGYQINFEHPMARGLVSFWAFNEGTGVPRDLAARWGPGVVTTPAATTNAWVSTPRGMAWRAAFPNNVLNLGVRPDLALSSGIFTFAAGLTVQNITQNGTILQLMDALGGKIQVECQTGVLALGAGNGTTSNGVYFPNFFDGHRHDIAAVCEALSSTGTSVYRDGHLFGQGNMGVLPVIQPSVVGNLFTGKATDIAGPVEYVALWYNRAFSGAEIADFTTNPWQIFEPKRTAFAIYMGTAPFAVSPSVVPTNRSAGVALTLTGQSPVVSWTTGSTSEFSLAIEPAGTSILSQSVSGPSAATITLATGPGTGDVAIVDASGNRSTITSALPLITASLTNLPSGHAGPMTIDLTVTLPVWTTGSTTTFSLVNAPTGTVLASQTVNSPTSATIAITTGSGIGAFSVSDGFESIPFQVVASVLTCSTPPLLTVEGTFPVTLTSTAAQWTHETASTLFSVAGGSGASFSNVVVVSDTQATADLAVGTAAGLLTLTDTSTGATAQVTVQAAPVGSLHLTGQMLLEHTGPNTGIFGGKNGAAVSFFFKANSNTGLNLTSGTTVIGWGTNANGPPLVAFCPALPGSLTHLKFYIASQGPSNTSFSQIVPIEIGVGYHFLLTWSVTTPANVSAVTTNGSNIIAVPSLAALEVGDLLSGTGVSASVVAAISPGVYQISANATATGTPTLAITRGTQNLYLNGQLYATANVPYATYAYQQIQVGGDGGKDVSGTEVALDHQVSNLAVWGSTSGASVPNAGDAAGLADGSLNPLGTSVPAGIWWALGGGATGSNPVLGSGGLIDLTNNGSTLTLVAGQLTNTVYAGAVTPGSPVTISAGVAKWGKVGYWGASLVPPLNGAQPIAPLLGVNATPTVYRNGTAIQTSRPLWNPGNIPGDPLTVCLLECGPVERIAVADGGSGYTAPTIAVSSGGLTLGTPVLATGVTGYQVIQGGSGFNSSPRVAIVDMGGSGSGATAIAMVNGSNQVAQVNVLTGGTNYVDPVIYISDGYNEVLTAVLNGTTKAITSVTVGNGGAGFANGTMAVLIVDATGTGALATATVANNAITSINVLVGGSGYTDPTFIVYQPSPTYTSGQATATATVAGGVVTGAYMDFLGSGYGEPPPITVAPPANFQGPTGNIQAQACVHVTDGSIDYVFPLAGDFLGRGTGYVDTNPPCLLVGTGTLNATTVAYQRVMPSITLGSGTTAGQIESVTINGNTMPSGFSSTPYIVFADSTTSGAPGSGSGATATAVLSGNSLTSITINTPGSNYTAPSMTITGGSSAVSIRPIVSTYIDSVPVTSGGDYATPPTLTVSDPTGTGAVLHPMMGGVLASDTMTYSAPAGWLTPTDNGYATGGVPAVTAAPMSNWTGQFEGQTGALWPIAVTPTLGAAANMPSIQSYSQNDVSTYKNALHASPNPHPWSFYPSQSGTITPATSVLPTSWSVTSGSNMGVIGMNFSNVLNQNFVDEAGIGSRIGDWTAQYTDPNVNTDTAAAVWLGAGGQTTVTPVQLSGPSFGPVVMSAADIQISNGQITGITTSNTNLGSGYEAAGVIISGGNGKGAAAIAIVQGGSITSFVVVSGGNSYNTSNLPTITVYGTKLSGTQVTAAFNIQYSVSNPWVNYFPVTLWVGQAQQQFTISNPWVVRPNGANGNQAVGPFDSSNEYAADETFLAYLATANGGVPAALRWMDSTQGYGGDSNFIDAADLAIPQTALGWGATETNSATFAYIRFFNTNPADTNYTLIDGVTPYSSPRLYGSQAIFCSGVDSSFTTYGGETVAGVPYLDLPPTELGNFVGPAGYVAVELRSMVPHNLKTGQKVTVTASCYLVVDVTSGGSGYTSAPTVTISGGQGTVTSATATISGGVVTGVTVIGSYGYAVGDNVTVQFSGGGGSGAVATATVTLAFSVPTTGGTFATNVTLTHYNLQSMVFVTGPYTVFTGIYMGGSNQQLLTPTEVPASVVLSNQVPYGGSPVVPYEFAATTCAELGSGYWCNLPPVGSDALWQTIAQKVAANIGPTVPIYLEYGNENWNAGFVTYHWQQAMSNLLQYVPVGQQALDYFTGNGVTQPYPQSLVAAHAFKVFEDAAVAAGISSSRIKRVYGAQWITGSTAGMLDVVQQWGAPADYLCVAPYQNIPASPTIVQACSPRGSWGSTTGGAGGWPIPAIMDTMRLFMAYGVSDQILWSDAEQACQTFGQPLIPLSLSSTNATAVANLSPTSIASITVQTPGSNFTETPTVVLEGGGGTYTSATVTLSGGAISAITVTGSQGYTSPPTVLILGGGAGEGTAYATANLTPTSVASFTITDGGAGYNSSLPPLVTLTGGGGSGAVPGAVTISNGLITNIGSPSSGGSGYTSAPTVTIQGGGSLPAGNYYVTYTFKDSQGRETTAGLSRSGLFTAYSRGTAGANGTDFISLAMPAWPPWATAMNVYVTQPNGAPGSETYYTTIPVSEYGAGHTYPIGSPFVLTLPLSTTGTPAPTVNNAAPNTPNLPRLACYETSLTSSVPRMIPMEGPIVHDCFSHPSYADAVYTLYSHCQTGCPSQGPGAAIANYFSLYQPPSAGFMWVLAYGMLQPPGNGASNQYATIQGGPNADAHWHITGATPNQSTGLQGLLNWIAATGATPTPTPTQPRRWFSGLRRPVMRLGS